MKRTQFIRELADAGCELKRHGKKHDIYINQQNGKKTPVPRCRLAIPSIFRMTPRASRLDRLGVLR